MVSYTVNKSIRAPLERVLSGQGLNITFSSRREKFNCLERTNILVTLKNNPAFEFATSWLCSDYMHEMKCNVEAGMCTSEADLMAAFNVFWLESTDPGVVGRLTSRSFNPATASEDFNFYPPSSLSGAMYVSCTGGTVVVMSGPNCEVWIYDGGKNPVAVLRNEHLEVLDYPGWNKVWFTKREVLESVAANITYPQEWYLLEEEYDTVSRKELKKKMKQRNYPENLQDRFRQCIPAREWHFTTLDDLFDLLKKSTRRRSKRISERASKKEVNCSRKAMKKYIAKKRKADRAAKAAYSQVV